jgi:hypothetical protein
MTTAATLLLGLAAVLFLGGCRHIRFTRGPAAAPTSAPAAVATLPPATRTLAPSPRLIVGRVLAVDPPRGFAVVELASDAPPASLAEGAELTTRTAELRETAQVRASRHLRGRTLGTTVISGQPTPGDEVVWEAP